MAVLAKLLESGCLSQSRVEEAGYHKLAAQIIFREFQEADEANLLDEEDMHVYGLKPMDDPLDLVCCNACKKPVKASQYAAHADSNHVDDFRLGTNCIKWNTQPASIEERLTLAPNPELALEAETKLPSKVVLPLFVWLVGEKHGLTKPPNKGMGEKEDDS